MRRLTILLIIVLCIAAFLYWAPIDQHTLIIENITYEKTDDVLKVHKDDLPEPEGLLYNITMNISLKGELLSIDAIEEIKIRSNRTITNLLIFKNTSVAQKHIERIVVESASADVRAFYDSSLYAVLLNMTPESEWMSVKIYYHSTYDPLQDKPQTYIENHLNQNPADFYYLPLRAYVIDDMLPSKNQSVLITINPPANYTLAVLEEVNAFWSYRAILPENGAFKTDGHKPFYILLSRKKLYNTTIRIGNKTVSIRALTDEPYAANKLKDIIEFYSHVFMPYPYEDFTYIKIKGRRSNYKGHGLYGGIIASQFKTGLIAHETAHNWFGIYANFGALNEPLATYADILYENNSRIIDLLEVQCISSKDRTPIASIDMNNGKHYTNLYLRGAFIFRSLQFTIGDDAFFDGIKELLRECRTLNCYTTTSKTIKIMQRVFEETSNQSLGWFFDEWFYRSDYPKFVVTNATIKEKGDMYILTLNITEENGFMMPLEVMVEDERGSTLLKKVFVNGSASIRFELKGKPKRIILDPNDWIANKISDGNTTNQGLSIKEKGYYVNGIFVLIN
ncbi:hypothetical protein PAP_01575 [Palaeococcus pacificus DY20341]|uniref:Peptidase M1 membrane alanine aminopeptidase domain-containing protein n=1 Tax=Palaeococcus pacificus DY20341 TaxID=1343739 RepID=A0A075LR14_9EURY|nr:hypothetical protein [Palaeococcus pacificus]AIF68754.1 hypothetical protein PAP_01575 [Palaeococcus pacificus DY20341]